MKLNIELFNELSCLDMRDDLLCALRDASDSDKYFYEVLDELETSGNELLVDSLRNTYGGCMGEAFDAGILYGMVIARELEKMKEEPVKMLEEYTKYWPSARESYPVKEKPSDRVGALKSESNAKFNN